MALLPSATAALLSKTDAVRPPGLMSSLPMERWRWAAVVVELPTSIRDPVAGPVLFWAGSTGAATSA